MSKIIQAMNIMISRPSNISNVIKSDDELFFLYLQKQKWSIRKSNEDGSYRIYYYKLEKSLNELVNLDIEQWNQEDYINYSTIELTSIEAYQTFEQLYILLNEKVSGIDDVFNEIIEDDNRVPF